jgi:hypothetical protein
VAPPSARLVPQTWANTSENGAESRVQALQSRNRGARSRLLARSFACCHATDGQRRSRRLLHPVVWGGRWEDLAVLGLGGLGVAEGSRAIQKWRQVLPVGLRMGLGVPMPEATGGLARRNTSKGSPSIHRDSFGDETLPLKNSHPIVYCSNSPRGRIILPRTIS